MHRIALALFLTLFLITAPPALAWTESTPNVPINDRVYRQIDRLVASGLVKDVIYGQRPWSRSEIARIIEEAIRHRAEVPPPIAPDDREIALWLEIDDLLEKMKDRFREELIQRGTIEGEKKRFSLHPLSYVEAGYTFVDSDARAVPVSNGLGSIDAFISPLTAYREGRHFPDGHQFSVETEHYARLTRFFSIYARPRFQLEVRDNKDVQFNPFAQQLYAKLTLPHFELEVGRDSVEWGQGEFGGILLSNNARPLDMIKISNPSPSILPWLFKYIGPLRYTLLIANLGPEREFPYSFLTGFKLSAKPVSFFEIGFSHLMVLGGDGAPGVSVGGVLEEFFIHRTGDRTTNVTNHQVGLDARIFLPFMRNSQIYIDTVFEDARKTSYVLAHLANYQAGFYIPRLDQTGTMSLRLEYRHGSPYYARNAPFITGMTLNRRILGDELGPQADGGYVDLSWDPSERLNFTWSLLFERRRGDVLAETADNLHLVTITSAPAELRFSLVTRGVYDFNAKTSLTMALGYERTQKYNFVTGDNRNGFLASAGLRFNLW